MPPKKKPKAKTANVTRRSERKKTKNEAKPKQKEAPNENADDKVLDPVVIQNEHASGSGDKGKEKIGKDLDKPQRKKIPADENEPGVAEDIDALDIHPQLESEVQLRPRKHKEQPVIKPFSLELIGDDFTV